LLNNLDVILEAAKELVATPASFVLVGQGPDKAKLEERARAAGLSNVHFLPAVPKTAVPAILAAADALIVSFAPQPLFRFGVSPNKLMDYMMAGKPIIAAMRAGNNPVEEHGCGLTAPPDDAREVASCVSRLMAMSVADRDAMGARGRAAVETVYSYTVLARRFAECF
jgi:glycosyltransferase involved in cell wall biosynthesis